MPPTDKGDSIQLSDIVQLDVEYPHIDEHITIPDDHLTGVVREWRKNLEQAVLLEGELGALRFHNLVSIERDSNAADGQEATRLFGIDAAFIFFVNLMKRLIAKDAAAARQECSAWWVEEETVFARLRIWVCGDTRMFSGAEAVTCVSGLSDDAFWRYDHQRDLLVVLRKRWADFPSVTRSLLERRLLDGPPRWSQTDEVDCKPACNIDQVRGVIGVQN